MGVELNKNILRIFSGLKKVLKLRAFYTSPGLETILHTRIYLA